MTFEKKKDIFEQNLVNQFHILLNFKVIIKSNPFLFNHLLWKGPKVLTGLGDVVWGKGPPGLGYRCSEGLNIWV
jgi:hypothetical protein